MVKLIAAIVPEEPYFSLIRKCQIEFNQLYGGNEVLKYPVHNTLVSMGDVRNEGLKEVYMDVLETAVKTKPFKAYVDGMRFYGSNENAIGVYLNVRKTGELQQLHGALVGELREFQDMPRAHKELELYNPHISIWYPDNLKELTKSGSINEDSAEMKNWRNAIQYIPERKGHRWPPRFSFSVNRISLLYKTEDMDEYEVLKEFLLGRSL